MGGSLDGDAGRSVLGIARLSDATADEVNFCALVEYRAQVADTGAAAVIVAVDFEPPTGTPVDLALIRVDNPYLAAANVVHHFFPEREPPASIHPSAVIADSAEIGDGVAVGPRTVVGEDCVIGSGTRLGAGCVLAAGTRVGDDCRMFPNVTLYRCVVVGDRVIIHAGKAAWFPSAR